MKKLISILITGSFIAVILVRTVFATTLEVNYNINNLMENILEESIKHPEVVMSSNPYKYIENNEYYDSLVEIGTEAIPIMIKDIKNSEENGLREYILAIAVEEISKTNLKKISSYETLDYDKGWSNAKAFAEKWTQHLHSIPSEVNNIVQAKNKTDEDKINELVSLGTPAIPYILDKIQEGNNYIYPSLDELLKNSKNKKINSIQSNDNNKYNELAKTTISEFDILRNMVEKEQ
ncbi:hypothetical protein UT300018_27310 [Clostridium faecium]